MSTIINIDNSFPVRELARSTAPPLPSKAAERGASADKVEFSEFGRALAQAVEQSSLSIARTRAIRAEIESGTYETRERIDVTAERLLDVIA